MTEGNKLLLTTHSPYVLNYTSLAIKAHNVLSKIPENDEGIPKKIKASINDIVPVVSALDKNGVHIYEIDEDGSIALLETYNGIPTDENHLNQILAETNTLFDTLLELEDELDD
jgi:hypothetical protein